MRSIISFLTFIVEGIAKAIVFLLSTLGLWIPALFCLLFFAVCAITQTAFAEVSVIFFVGLTLSCLLALSIMVSQVIRKREKKHMEKNGIAPRPLKKKKEENKESEQVQPASQFITPNIIQQYPAQNAPYQGYAPGGYPAQNAPWQYAPSGYAGMPYPQQPYMQPNYFQQPYNASYPAPVQNGGEYRRPDYAAPAGPNYRADNQGGYYGAGGGQYGAPAAGSPYRQYNAPTGENGTDNNRSVPGDSMFEQAKRSMRAEFAGYNPPAQQTSSENPPEQEKPLGVFRTRSDPRVLIYEYADRLDYWRKADNGQLEYIRTETKRA